MAFYEIIETPGKQRVYPMEGDTPIRNQDEAKIHIARLRSEAKAEGRKVDFVMKRDTERATTGTAATGTSIRLTENNRSQVARFCGRVMMETGDPVSMGDAVALLVRVASAALDAELVDFQGEIQEDTIITMAKGFIAERKAAKK